MDILNSVGTLHEVGKDTRLVHYSNPAYLPPELVLWGRKEKREVKGMVRNEESTACLAHRQRKEVLGQVMKDVGCLARESVTLFGGGEQ